MIDREAEKSRNNRAVTPFFQIFGGGFRIPQGDAMRLADMMGGHRGEWRFLSVLMPAVLGGALFDGLWRLGGQWLAWLGILPGLFFALNALAFILGGSKPKESYWRWSLVLTAWAVAQILWLHSAGVAWAVAFWILWIFAQVPGIAGLLWRRAMQVSGKSGVRVRWLLAVGLHGLMALLWWQFGWPYGVACGGLIAGLWCVGTFCPTSELYGPVAKRVEGKGPLLTIDDGPDPQDTPVILDALDAAGVKAVFFVIGEKVAKYPELAREIVRRGHELGNHTMTHPQASFWGAGSVRTRREIARCSEAIETATGTRPRWFRAPVGHRNYFTHPIATELGMEVVAWTHRGYDAVMRDVPAIVRQITTDVVDGDILLMHEATPVAQEVVAGVFRALEKTVR